MMSRLLNWFRTTDTEQQLELNRIDFVKYADEYDKRRNTNFLETFPNLHRFYYICISFMTFNYVTIFSMTLSCYTFVCRRSELFVYDYK